MTIPSLSWSSALGNWKYTVTAEILRLVRAERTRWKETICPVLDSVVGAKMGMKKLMKPFKIPEYCGQMFLTVATMLRLIPLRMIPIAWKI